MQNNSTRLQVNIINEKSLNQNNYFDNETILEQLERLFKLIYFKKEYVSHDIVMVDNATTHTAKAFKISHFRKSWILFKYFYVK